MDARDITKVLAEKHRDDVFVPECNLGSAWARCRRMDGWAMKKSWASPLITGYEVKVSRQDFLNDQKWQEYLPFCNEFYWVCPWKLIAPEEVGEGAGLMWVTNTGTRLIRKVKAPWREIEPANMAMVMGYVLMSRATIGAEIQRLTEKERWQEWLKERQVDKRLGDRVGKAIRRAIDEKVIQVQRENEILSEKMSRYDKVREAMVELGMDPDRPPRWGAKQDVERAAQIVDQHTLGDLKSLSQVAGRLHKALADLNERARQ